MTNELGLDYNLDLEHDHVHDPLIGCAAENCSFRLDGEGLEGGIADSDDEANAANSIMLHGAGFTAAAVHETLMNRRSDSDSSISSFTNLTSACSDKIEELKAEEVRWFYKHYNDKKWVPFVGYDSLHLEERYRNLKQEIKDFLTLEKIYVRGGLYETDVESRVCTSIYWAGEEFKIMRATWFHDGSWQPLDECSAEQIEIAHLKKFLGSKCSDYTQSTPSKGAKPVILNVQLTTFHVDWNGPREVYLFSEATPSKLVRSFSQRIGLQKSGYRLHRGYSEEATPTDKPADITHLIFVIHGIGQKGETSKIIRNCSKLRDAVTFLKKKYFHALKESEERSEFFPVEWRSNLKLDGDTVESVTPHKIRGLRELLNRTAMDIMYYTSPMYRTEIVNCLSNELNRLYGMFCQRNPSFESGGGKVSVVAHSLGCVIMYDILTGFNPVQLYLKDLVAESSRDLNSEEGKTTQQLMDLEASLLERASKPKESMTAFTVENFFCLGSPLAVFLALRGFRPETEPLESIVPRHLVKKMFNIYHPSDPVAYRLEPLIKREYGANMPLQIHYYATIDKTPYETMPVEPLIPSRDEKTSLSKESVEEPKSPDKTCKSGRWSMIWPGWRKTNNSAEQDLLSMVIKETKVVEKGDIAPDFAGNLENNIENHDGITDHSPTATEMDTRLDFVLREGNMDSFGYLAAFTAHTCYWSNYDVAYFILNYLHPGMD
uniref:DDHD domain-containing protein n=1 Tax=Strigamia maritima TaxID=126957 RepID=T1JGN6_STRMM